MAIALSSTSRPSSNSSLATFSGGITLKVFLPAVIRINPSSKHAFVMACYSFTPRSFPFLVFTISTPMNNPFPLTSPTIS